MEVLEGQICCSDPSEDRAVVGLGDSCCDGVPFDSTGPQICCAGQLNELGIVFTFCVINESSTFQWFWIVTSEMHSTGCSIYGTDKVRGEEMGGEEMEGVGVYLKFGESYLKNSRCH